MKVIISLVTFSLNIYCWSPATVSSNLLGNREIDMIIYLSCYISTCFNFKQFEKCSRSFETACNEHPTV